MSKTPAIRLTPTQKWEVAKYCIEHKGVIIKYTDGQLNPIYEFRVGQSLLAKEISERLFKINSTHLKDCMEFYLTVIILSDNLPVIPKEATVEEDMLKIELTKKEEIIKRLQDQIKELNNICETHKVTVANYKDRFIQIRKLGSV